jgi:hypothetical protein
MSVQHLVACGCQNFHSKKQQKKIPHSRGHSGPKKEIYCRIFKQAGTNIIDVLRLNPRVDWLLRSSQSSFGMFSGTTITGEPKGGK